MWVQPNPYFHIYCKVCTLCVCPNVCVLLKFCKYSGVKIMACSFLLFGRRHCNWQPVKLSNYSTSGLKRLLFASFLNDWHTWPPFATQLEASIMRQPLNCCCLNLSRALSPFAPPSNFPRLPRGIGKPLPAANAALYRHNKQYKHTSAKKMLHKVAFIFWSNWILLHFLEVLASRGT